MMNLRLTSPTPPNRLRSIGFGALFCLALAQTTQAAVIEFTSGEGYANGNLASSADWENPSGTPTDYFTVNNVGAGTVAVDFTNGTTARLSVFQSAVDFTSGQAYTTSIDFSFTENLPTISTTSTTFLQLVYFTGASGGTVTGSIGGIGRTNAANGYRIAFANSSNTFLGTAIGVDSANGDLQSDDLRMTVTLQRGATLATWIGTETLLNLTTGQVVATRTSSAINVGATAHDDSSLFAGFGQGTSYNLSGITSLTVASFNTPTVPEPGSAALVGLAGAAMLVIRRRRNR